jgi:phosphomannomutase
MKIKPNIFRDYDVRAVIPDELDKEGAIRIGKVLAYLYKPKEAAIGHDMRISADDIAGGISQGLTDQGVNVIDLGLISTDMAYFAAGKYKYDLALSVSASHNPSEYNGFKLVKKGAIAVSGRSGIYKIRDLALSDKKFESSLKKGRIIKKNINDAFIKHCLGLVNLKNIKPFKVVVDAGNAMAGYIMPKFAKFLPLKIVPMFFELDGTFPNHIPNPLLPEATKALKKRVIKEKADFGIAFDGDGDRMYFIDNQGKLVSGTVTTAMIAQSILQKNPGVTILYNAVTGRVVPETIKKFGGKAIRVRVGHTLIKEDMRKYNAYFAGEHSGHYYFKPNYYADSAFIAMLVALELISQKNKPLSEIVSKYDIYPNIAETNFEVKDKQQVMKSLEKIYQNKANAIDWLDGITIWFNDSWVNVRPSNTQPLLRLNIEADNKTILKKKTTEFISKIKSLGGKLVKE